MNSNDSISEISSSSSTRIRKRDLLRNFVSSKTTGFKQELKNYYFANNTPRSIASTETQNIDEIIQSSVPEIVQPQCIIFPTYACQLIESQDIKYKIILAGWAFSKPPSSRLDRFLLAAGRTYGGLARNSIEDNHFSTLLNQFRCQTMRMVDIKLTLPGIIAKKLEDHLTPEQQEKLRDYAALVNSGESGRFQEEVIINKDDLLRSRYLNVEASFMDNDQSFPGYVDMIEPNGISIISDIDDTIKITDILDGKDAILQNTFFRTARQVPHMSEVYQAWATEGAHFHYVSNSPWQVFPALSEFMITHQFPKGSMHLRAVTTQQLISGKPGRHKLQTISKILRDFPSRKFILVGDSGEIDPEIYQEIYHAFPNQIIKIFIHDVSSRRAIESDRIARDKPDSYFRIIRKFLVRESTNKGLAIDAMTETEVPEDQQQISNPEIPTLTKLEQFENRMEKVSSDMREGVFTVFTLASQLMLDPYVAEEFLMLKK